MAPLKVVVQTAYQDTFGSVSFDGELPASADFADYRVYISEFVRKHQDHIAIQRLRRNIPITMTDIEEFTIMLEIEQPGTKAQFSELLCPKVKTLLVFL